MAMCVVDEESEVVSLTDVVAKLVAAGDAELATFSFTFIGSYG